MSNTNIQYLRKNEQNVLIKKKNGRKGKVGIFEEQENQT